MLCSQCNKNNASIFLSKLDKDGKPSGETEGLCIECAKKRGVNPLSSMLNQMKNISEEDLTKMSESFNNLMGSIDPETLEKITKMPFGNMFDSMDLDDLSNNFENFSNDDLDSATKDTETISSKEDETEANVQENSTSKKKKKLPKLKYLSTFGENLTQKARDNELDLVIGRQTELQRMIQILNRRGKNNPVLIGEPGVGKTAIINALAIAIANGEVPNKLLDKEVFLIDMTSLVAGTQFRGQFESRIKGLIDECKSLSNVIIAIDEVHNIVGGLEHDNSMNAANMLKPALANGSIQLIGATTLKEYRQYIEKDAALERRFQPVMVDEPTSLECFEILKGLKSYYEDFHSVIISDDILKQSISLSSKYIHDRFLPDKAIDLLDEASSRVNLNNKNLAKIDAIKKSLDNLNEDLNAINLKISDLEANPSSANEEEKISEFKNSAYLKEKICQLELELDGLKKKNKSKNVTIEDLASVIELWTKIPVAKIKTSEAKKLLNLKENLENHIIGQNEAIEALSSAIIRKRADIKTVKRPPSFIFVGPTGVGKTFLVKSLAYELFDNEDAVIKLDMSEYMESHSVSKLIGSPPGYVGYDEAGGLTEKVRRKPYSIVLFDEIEKAHQNIYNILLQILEDGKLTDSQGRSVSFKHTVIVITSNLGTNFKNDAYGFLSSSDKKVLENKVNDSLRGFFSPEFLNRIDDTIIFKKLSKEDIQKIAELMIKELQKETKEKNILFDYTQNVLDFIVNDGFNENFGARPLRRSIQKHIEDLIAINYITGNISENKKITLYVIDNKVVII